ncbi:trace amine-associated receptor 1-like [Sphaeramia orbicularis]|uniref:trace amine-associated receptor 1-like n=1 Tax=Sphaeramia orbicularis TaxID=375764 RepID=UPI00117DD1B6|nr:trace amine-associated receptor 1-like [Sphaeramia orbicularis]
MAEQVECVLDGAVFRSETSPWRSGVTEDSKRQADPGEDQRGGTTLSIRGGEKGGMTKNTDKRLPVVSQTEVLLYHILLFIFSPLTVALNLMVIISVSHFRQLHTPTNLLLLSLAVSDLLAGLVMMPGEIQVKLSCWFLGDYMCSLYTFLAWLSVSVSVGDMVLISVDRYVAICDPLHYTNKARAMRSHITSITAQHSGKAVANKSELKAARSLGVLVGTFLICFCPYYIVTLTDNRSVPSLPFYLTFILYLNSCLNPLIYSLFYPWFRKAVRLIFTLQILQSDSCDSTMV